MDLSLSRAGRIVVALVLASLVSCLLAAAGPASAAKPKPRGLEAALSASAVVLKWRPVGKATSYDVEVASGSGFDRVIYGTTTINVAATPTGTLPSGRISWRVRANFSNGESAWASAAFSRSENAGPLILEPADGVVLQQPEAPSVLRWQPVPGAESYVVEIDGAEEDWVDTETYSTETTSLVPTEPQPNGTYHWRVRAVFDGDIASRPSSPRSYRIGPLHSVVLHEPDDDDEFPEAVREVVLSWDPVPGAVAYEVRISTDNGFNVITDQKKVSGTRYSPTTTFNNASYWWQVRALNVFGHSEDWPEFPSRTGEFRRHWPQKAALTAPADGAAVGLDDLSFRWQPVELASHYLLDVGTEPNFSSTRYFNTCETRNTTYAPGRSSTLRGSDGCTPKASGTYYWRVRVVDGPRNVNSLISDVRSFEFTAPAPATGTLSAVTGQRLLLDGDGRQACSVALPSVCSDVTQTPLFDWSPVPGAAYYRIYLAHDASLTNIVRGYGDPGRPNTLPATVNTRWNPVEALPDTQAGEAYYWYVRPCDAQDICGPTPTEASNAYQKKSVPVQLVSPAPGASVADQVVFDWTDYLQTNLATTDPSTGERPGQAARQYRIQVSDTNTFLERIDEEVVDQTTYTAFNTSYPEGELWWRVQAIDGSGNGLTWSEPRKFLKSSPVPTIISPTSGSVFGGVQPFRWTAMPYTKYYDLEVYRNNDRAASDGNLALYARNVRHSAYTADEPLQALGQDFVWRVRRTDYAGNKSGWSSWQSFRVAADPARLTSPGASVKASRALFTWRASTQAAYYRLEIRQGDDTDSVVTRHTAYAVTGSLDRGKVTWRVISYDNQGDVLRASSWRRTKVM